MLAFSLLFSLYSPPLLPPPFPPSLTLPCTLFFSPLLFSPSRPSPFLPHFPSPFSPPLHPWLILTFFSLLSQWMKGEPLMSFNKHAFDANKLVNNMYKPLSSWSLQGCVGKDTPRNVKSMNQSYHNEGEHYTGKALGRASPLKFW